MNGDLKTYLWLETKVAAAFNFFINGMIAALIYHQTDYVPVDFASITIDISVTSLIIFMITTFFSHASLKRNKASGILKTGHRQIKRLSGMLRDPILYGVFGLTLAAVLWLLIMPVWLLSGIQAISFGTYILVKSILCAVLGGSLTLFELYIGMISEC